MRAIAVNRLIALTVLGRYQLRAEVATVQIHELASLRSSPISTDPLVGDDAGRPCYGMTDPVPPGDPMTLGNMRKLGVYHLVATCLQDACRHQGLIDVSKYAKLA